MAGDLLSRWRAAGTDELMLPTGTEVRVMLPGAGDLARRGLTPSVLRGVVARRTGQDDRGGMSDEDWTRWEVQVRELICETVVAVRPPGEEAFSEWQIDPADLEERRLPGVDHDALVALVLRLESPAQVDSRSRVATLGMPATTAASVWTRAAQLTLPGWQDFVGSDEAMACAIAARTWSCRPSELLVISDPVVAYSVDEALAMRLLQLRGRKPRGPLPDEYYEKVQPPPFDPDAAAATRNAHLELLRAEGRIH